MDGSRISSLTVGFLLVAGPPAVGWEGTPADQGLALQVDLYNYAELPESVVASARETAATVFQRAGVSVIWMDVPTAPEGLAAFAEKRRRVGAAELVVRLVSEPMVPHWAKRDELAFALIPKGGGLSRIVSIYTERIARAAAREGYSVGPLLGCVMAHEIGHLLLGAHSHSATGIMSYPVTGQYLSRATRAELSFSSSQAERIRKDIRRRLERDSASSGISGAQSGLFGGTF
jgi:hypothetical protein